MSTRSADISTLTTQSVQSTHMSVTQTISEQEPTSTTKAWLSDYYGAGTLDFPTFFGLLPIALGQNGEQMLIDRVKATTLQFFIAHLHDVNPNDGRTALHYAAEAGGIKTLAWLIRLGLTRYDKKDRDGHTPLALAAHQGHLACVVLLLQQYQNVDISLPQALGQKISEIAQSVKLLNAQLVIAEKNWSYVDANALLLAECIVKETPALIHKIVKSRYGIYGGILDSSDAMIQKIMADNLIKRLEELNLVLNYLLSNPHYYAIQIAHCKDMIGEIRAVQENAGCMPTLSTLIHNQYFDWPRLEEDTRTLLTPTVISSVPASPMCSSSLFWQQAPQALDPEAVIPHGNRPSFAGPSQ